MSNVNISLETESQLSNPHPNGLPETPFHLLTVEGASLETIKALQQQEREAAFRCYTSQTRFLLGKVLTIIDGSTPDKDQRKALKDVLKWSFQEQEKHTCEVMTGQRLYAGSEESLPPSA